jgi:hypothetical protein
VFGEPLASNGLFVAAVKCVTDPLPSNGHIRQNIHHKINYIPGKEVVLLLVVLIS